MRILLYSDSYEYGGHEKMITALASQLLSVKGNSVVFYVNRENSRFIDDAEKLKSKFGTVSISLHNHLSKNFPSLRLCFECISIKRIVADFKKIKPDIVVVGQGNIELGLKGAFASKVLGLTTCSYIPYTTRLYETGAKFAKIRDYVNHLFYKLFDKFIVIDEFYKNDLVLSYKVDDENVFIVKNIVNENINLIERSTCRAKLKLEANIKLITLIGRVYFAQKGHDLAIQAIYKLHLKYPGKFRFVIVGDGPDLEKLKVIIKQYGAILPVDFMSWTPNPSLIYSATDVIIIPSRYEGVPMVMLEAMKLNVNIIASDLPIFKSYLPNEMLFKKDDPVALFELLEERVISADANEIISYGTVDENILDFNQKSIKKFLKTSKLF